MGIPIYVPDLKTPPLVTTIMARIAQGEAISRTAVAKAQLALKQQQAQMDAEAAQSSAAQQNAQTAQQNANLAAQQAPLRSALLQAQTARLQQQTKAPFAGQLLPGAAGEAQGMQMLVNRFGQNSPVVQRAFSAFNAKVKLQNARSDYYSANVGLKNLPSLRKQQITNNWEMFNSQRLNQDLPAISFQDWLSGPGANQVKKHDIVKTQDLDNHAPLSNNPAQPITNIGAPHPKNAPVNAMPGGAMHNNDSLTPEQATTTPEDFKSESQNTQLKIEKSVTDPTIFKKWINFNNILNTINDVDPKMMARYTGINGAKNIAFDRAKSLSGVNIPMFDEYNSFITETVPSLADMTRQAYGTSIDPKVLNMLKTMANPIVWKNSPGVGAAQWDKYKALILERRNVLHKFVGLNQAREEGEQAPQRAPQTDLSNVSTADLVKQLRGE